VTRSRVFRTLLCQLILFVLVDTNHLHSDNPECRAFGSAISKGGSAMATWSELLVRVGSYLAVASDF
jgi:hypothetical protein